MHYEKHQYLFCKSQSQINYRSGHEFTTYLYAASWGGFSKQG